MITVPVIPWTHHQPPPVEPCCPYCGAREPGWLASDVLAGKRVQDGSVEYHCPGAIG